MRSSMFSVPSFGLIRREPFEDHVDCVRGSSIVFAAFRLLFARLFPKTLVCLIWLGDLGNDWGLSQAAGRPPTSNK